MNGEKNCTECHLEKKTAISTIRIQNVKIVIAQGNQNFTMRMKKKFQINKRYIMKQNRDETLLQKQKT